jgi:hypothetical protein
VSVDFDKKEASFQVKKGEKFDSDKLQEAIAGSGAGKMGEVKSAPK